MSSTLSSEGFFIILLISELDCFMNSNFGDAWNDARLSRSHYITENADVIKTD